MKVTELAIPDVLLIEPKKFGDDRGYFYESYNKKQFEVAVGKQVDFVQDNQSRSSHGVVRGLHYQIKQAQGKLVRAIAGEIYDVAVDLRSSSPTFGKWVGINLSSQNQNQLWIPPGFAHGFAVLSDYAEVLYKSSDYYAPEYERSILWSDPDLRITWPELQKITLSEKDKNAKRLKDAEVYT